jgi:RimJ/RimL family protein N-acetyltransferase
MKQFSNIEASGVSLNKRVEENNNIEEIKVVGLVEFDKDYFYFISKDSKEKWKAIGMENCKNQRYYTAISENNVKLGIVGIYDTEDEQNITHIIIDPKFRGKGLLPKFYDLLLQKEELSFLTATVKIDNIPSIKSHEKAGFRKVSNGKYEKEFKKYKYKLDLQDKSAK